MRDSINNKVNRIGKYMLFFLFGYAPEESNQHIIGRRI
jgi:hypothetical protein